MIIDFSEISRYLPPGFSMSENSDYWQNLLLRADRLVKQACGRELEAGTYTDTGVITQRIIYDGVQYPAWWLREPKRDMTLDDISEIEIGGQEVSIVADSGIVLLPGGVLVLPWGWMSAPIKVVYSGGYCSNSTDLGVIASEVVRVMMALHRQFQTAGTDTVRSASVPFSAVSPGDLIAEIRKNLAAYVRVY